MSSSQKNWLVLLSVAVPTAAFSVFFLQQFGDNDENLRVILRLTARLAFLVYLVVFITRPLRQLVKTETTAWLLRERRSFGLAMASIHMVHMALIVYRANNSVEFQFEIPGNIVGSLIYVLMLLMVVTSFDRPARALGALNWRRLHKTGLYALGIAFVVTLLPETRAEILASERWWFVVLSASAVLIRLTAFFAHRRRPKERLR